MRRTPPLGLLLVASLTACREEPPAPSAPASPEACQALRARYRERWDAHQRCTEDADCTAERRDGPHRGLDPGCVRSGTWLTRFATDPVALDYALGGCGADSGETCEPPPAGAACRENRCVERAPEGVPASWVPATGGKGGKRFRLFLPPDLKDLQIPNEDDYTRLWKSERVAVFVHLEHGQRGPLVTDPARKRLSRTEVRASGFPAELVVEHAPAGTFRGSPDAWTTTLLRVGELGPAGPVFTLSIHCKGSAPCDEAKRIVDSLSLSP